MELLARGRDADVFALDARRVLRRCRIYPPSQTEIRMMRHLVDSGYPLPRLLDISGLDMVLERVDGPTMLTAFQTRGVAGQGRVLAALHNRLHAIRVPQWADASPTDRILHLDLHPDNVILAEAGPVVIDWSNVSLGPPALDVADSLILLRTGQVQDDEPPELRHMREQLAREFLAEVAHDPGPLLPQALRARIANVNVTASEVAVLTTWLNALSSADPEAAR